MIRTDLQLQVHEKTTAAATSVIAAVFLTLIKIIIGVMTGSLGILAEAVHSALDLGAAVMTLVGVRVSDRPADASHPYGHRKIENLTALAETLLLLVTCAWIIYEGINRLFFKAVEVDPSVWAFLTMGISIAIDASRSRVLYRAARKYHSQALEADALHFSTDIWSSVVVIIGLGLVWVGRVTGHESILMRADAVAALGVATIVIFVSIRLGRRAVDALMDTAPPGLAEQAASAAAAVEGVQEVLRTRVRGSGNDFFVDLRMAVPRHLSLEETHAVTDRVQEAVRAIAPGADVVIHTVPAGEPEGVLERIQTVAARGHYPVHNVTTHLTNRGMWIDLDLEVPPDVSLERAHALATALETELRAELGSLPELAVADVAPAAGGAQRIADVNVHIEPRAERLGTARELTARETAEVEERVKSTCRGIPHIRGCYDIDVQELRSGVYLAFHLLINRDLSLGDVHGIAEEMENRLRRQLPQLGRVVIHTEPFLDEDHAPVE